MHRLLAMRTRMRGGPGNLRTNRGRPWISIQHQNQHRTIFRLGMRILRRLRPGLPHRDLNGEICH